MSRIVRIAKKLITTPGPSVRDYLLRKHPLANEDPSSDYFVSIQQGLMQPTFPVDVVYTWVDSEDPDFRQSLGKHRQTDNSLRGSATAESRWMSHDELRYSLRSLEAYAPWVRKIFIVTNGQRPRWLLDHPRVQLVFHEDILEKRYLPTFNSHVLSSALHKIEGLSEHYIYFNDDVLLLRPTSHADFFTENGMMYGFISPVTVPNGPLCDLDLPSVWAAKNSAALIFQKWGVMFRNRMKHTFVPQRRSVAYEVEEAFSEEYAAFRLNKFRAQDDLLCSGFLHPYVAYVTGKGFLRRNRTSYVQVRDRKSEGHYAQLLSMKGTAQARVSTCLNDAGDSGDFDYRRSLLTFLEAYYPERSSFEAR